MAYDMDGLAMYDDGMGAWLTKDMLKEQAMAAGSGAAGILLASAIVQRIPFESWIEDGSDAASAAATRSYLRSASALAIGVVGGRVIWERSQNAAMGFVGGVAGLALAQLVAKVAGNSDDGTPYLTTGLAGHRSGVSEMDLARLEAAVASSNPAFSPGAFAGTQVTSRALSAAGVTNTVLAEYAPYLS